MLVWWSAVVAWLEEVRGEWERRGLYRLWEACEARRWRDRVPLKCRRRGPSAPQCEHRTASYDSLLVRPGAHGHARSERHPSGVTTARWLVWCPFERSKVLMVLALLARNNVHYVTERSDSTDTAMWRPRRYSHHQEPGQPTTAWSRAGRYRPEATSGRRSFRHAVNQLGRRLKVSSACRQR